MMTATAAPPVQPVAHVDPQRYAGTWYELARSPNRVQAMCQGNVTATYSPMQDGSLKVINRCRDAEDRWAVSVGHAAPAGGDASGARLKLSFLPSWLRWVPGTRADYWVVMLDDDYRYAVVSEPTREHLWILSRTPTMEGAVLETIVARLRELGYPVETLIPTDQQPTGPLPGAATRVRLIV